VTWRKRRSRRVEVRRVMKPLKAAFEVDGERLPGRVLNLGGTGMFVRTSSPPGSGAEVTVVIEDAGGHEVEARGTVRWSSAEENGTPAGFGMAIDSPSRDYVDLYEEMLRALDG
jgi:hypothetical protein